MTPSSRPSSRKRIFTHRPSSLGRLRNVFRSGSKSSLRSAHKIDGANFVARDFFVLAKGGQQIERGSILQPRGIQESAKGFPIHELDDDLFMGRCWGSSLQSAFARFDV